MKICCLAATLACSQQSTLQLSVAFEVLGRQHQRFEVEFYLACQISQSLHSCFAKQSTERTLLLFLISIEAFLSTLCNPLHCVYCLRHPFPHSHVHYSEGLYNSYGELQMRQSRGSSTNAELRKRRREQRRRRHLSPQAFSLSREKGDTCSAPKERVLSSHVLLIRLNCAG